MENLNFEECPVEILQNNMEFSRFIQIYEKLNPKKVVEIGSFYGGTLWYFLKHAELTHLTSIDLPVPESDGRYQQMVDSRAKWPEWIEDKGVRFNNLPFDSHAQNTIDVVRNLYADKDVDMLHIDGDHSYQGVIADYNNYKDIVRPGGLIVFHDVVGLEEVRNAFADIAKNHEHHEIIVEKPEVGWGIGIIYV